MGARIKFTGYLPVRDLEDGQFDPNDRTGLTGAAYDDLVAGENGMPLSISDLEDLRVELEL